MKSLTYKQMKTVETRESSMHKKDQYAVTDSGVKYLKDSCRDCGEIIAEDDPKNFDLCRECVEQQYE